MKSRVHIAVHGAVQGVGFRPFVYRLATELGLAGWVRNSSGGVIIDVDGEEGALGAFLRRLREETPPHASIQGCESSVLDPAGYEGFVIRESSESGPPTALVLPDLATCDDCTRELFTPSDRRYRYPFINCTNCGPRFSIIDRLPYDRPGTSMRAFAMCPDCAAEYADPSDRRFHAQPNACPTCGPRLTLLGPSGTVLADADAAVQEAIRLLRRGAVVACKGIGGFHLMVDAASSAAVGALRMRKRREEKPLAVMIPNLDGVRQECEVDEAEERLLRTPAAPIVLLRKRRGHRGTIAPEVAPRNPYLGVMLPSSPLHLILLHDFEGPVVATSGNLRDEPICIDNAEALERLRGIADAFLVHDRPILRHIDDSIIRVSLGRELVLRRARGFAPLPVTLPAGGPELLSVGAHLKNTVAVARGTGVFISQHLGDLETAESLRSFRHELASLQDLYAIRPTAVVSDLHPDYLSTGHARSIGLPLIQVQHHYAHIAACMADNQLEGAVLGVSWDGTGYGTDGTVWGGEFLLTDEQGYARVGSFRQFRLPGGEAAVREPRRSAFGALFELMGDALAGDDGPTTRSFTPRERTILLRMLKHRTNSPLTSSVGRLFDAVASVTGICQRSSFEGQGGMELEFAAGDASPDRLYPLPVVRDGSVDGSLLIADWGPALAAIVEDVRGGIPAGAIAAAFHDTLASVIAEMARRIGVHRVVLTGGCFQNRRLTEAAVRALRIAGFSPYWHQRVPPNDGGIALGQIYAAIRAITKQGS